MSFANVNKDGKQIEKRFRILCVRVLFCWPVAIVFYLCFVHFNLRFWFSPHNFQLILRLHPIPIWLNVNVHWVDDFTFLLHLQTSNGHRKFHNTTTSLSVPSTEDEMIDITPRETNYTSTMAGSDNYGRQSGSPSHSNAFTRDRDLNDVEGKNSTFRSHHFAASHMTLLSSGCVLFECRTHPFIHSSFWYFSLSLFLLIHLCRFRGKSCVRRAYSYDILTLSQSHAPPTLPHTHTTYSIDTYNSLH